MKRCVLHIGMHKTGSSSIQQYLHNHSAQLGNGINYAALEKVNHSGPIRLAFSVDHKRLSDFYRRGYSEKRIKKQSERFRTLFMKELQSDYRTLIFSAEGLTRLKKVEVADLYQCINANVENILVIAYIRHPISYVESAYQQSLKTNLPSPDLTTISPFYRKRLEKFEHIFGKIEYIPFAKEHLYQGCVVKDFCNRLEIPIFEYENKNSSMPLLAIKVLRAYQRLKKDNAIYREEVLKIIETISPLDNEKFRLPESEVDLIYRTQKLDIDWMQIRIPNFDLWQTELIPRAKNMNAQNLDQLNQKERLRLKPLLSKPQFRKIIINRFDCSVKRFLRIAF